MSWVLFVASSNTFLTKFLLLGCICAQLLSGEFHLFPNNPLPKGVGAPSEFASICRVYAVAVDKIAPEDERVKTSEVVKLGHVNPKGLFAVVVDKLVPVVKVVL